MQIDSIPSDYSSVFEANLYSISAVDAATPFTVEFRLADSSSTLIGAKRFSGSSTVEANISRYLSRLLRPAPVVADNRIVRPEGRTLEACAVCGGQMTPATLYTVAAQALRKRSLLSILTDRRIASGQTDEIAFTASSGDALSVVCSFPDVGEDIVVHSAVADADGIWVFALDADALVAFSSFPEQIRNFDIGLRVAGTDLGKIKYAYSPVAPRCVRLAWLNRLGAIDYFSFPAAVKESFVCSRRTANLPSGLKTADTEGYKLTEVVSGPLPRAQAEAISGLFASPLVWLSENNSFVPVTILSDNACLGGSEAGWLRFSFRPSEKAVFQNF